MLFSGRLCWQQTKEEQNDQQQYWWTRDDEQTWITFKVSDLMIAIYQ